MSDKQEVAQNENGGATYGIKRTKRRACADHCRKWWWLHLIIFICISVLVICLVIFVGVPKIAQDKVNDATLEVQGVNVLNATPNSFTMEINSTLSTDGTVKANIDPFEGEMYLEDIPDHTPFLKLQFPATNGDKHQMINISQTVQIDDHDAFNRFNVWFVANKTLRVTIYGRTQLTPAGLSKKYDVTFKKTIEMNGLNLLNGTQVSNGKILLEAVNGRNFDATAEIPNVSYYTLDIGNTSFTNFIDDTNIGTLYINNLFLRPGNNTVSVSANLDQAKVLTAIQGPKYCKTGVAPVKLQGATVVNEGQKLDYFLDGLSANNQTVFMDIGSIIKSSLNVTVACSS